MFIASTRLRTKKIAARMWGGTVRVKTERGRRGKIPQGPRFFCCLRHRRFFFARILTTPTLGCEEQWSSLTKMRSLPFSTGLIYVANFMAGTLFVQARFVENNVLAKANQQKQGKCLRRKKAQANRYVHCFYETEDKKDCSKDVGWYGKSKDRKGKTGEDTANNKCGGGVESDHVQTMAELSFEAGLSEQHAKKMARMLYSLADSGSKPQCSEMTQCFDCVQSSCTWIAGGCRDDCDIEDVVCYARSIMQDMSSREICKRYNDYIRDMNACDRQKSCQSCTGRTLPSDASRTCMWFERENLCMSECNMFDCEDTCRSDPTLPKPEKCETFVAYCALANDDIKVCACNARSSNDSRDRCELQTTNNPCMCAMCNEPDNDITLEDALCMGKAATKIGNKCQLVQDECETYVKYCVKDGEEESLCECGARSIYSSENGDLTVCAICTSDAACKARTAILVEGVCILNPDVSPNLG
mmetsp:Transcript_23568/g.69789  ORF Transcript_23568/g.69789 Transcript_23568/m.69789 type:complete len:472 (-) Transcript_23568:77-1492(-)